MRPVRRAGSRLADRATCGERLWEKRRRELLALRALVRFMRPLLPRSATPPAGGPARGFSPFSAPGSPQRAPGPSRNDSGRKTGLGERVGTSGDRVLKKIKTSYESGSTSGGRRSKIEASSRHGLQGAAFPGPRAVRNGREKLKDTFLWVVDSGAARVGRALPGRGQWEWRTRLSWGGRRRPRGGSEAVEHARRS